MRHPESTPFAGNEFLSAEMARWVVGYAVCPGTPDDARGSGIGNPTTRAQIPPLQPSSKPALSLPRHEHLASPGPDAALTEPFGAPGSPTGTARPTARLHRRSTRSPVGALIERVVRGHLGCFTPARFDRATPPPRQHHPRPAHHTRPTAVARVPGRYAEPGCPHRCAPGSA